MQIYEKPVRILMRDMADALALQPGQQFTKQQAIDWFAQYYPKIKTRTIAAHLVRLSTNVRNRLHHKPKPGEDDLFFQLDGEHYRRYNPNQDPAPIHSSDDKSNGKTPLEEDFDSQGLSEFAYESDLRNYLAKNLSVIEPGLTLYEEEEVNGIEFPAGGRRLIDILAVDPSGDFIVIELKVSRGYDRVVGQLMRYMAWIRQNHAEPGQKVRGIIVAREISDDLLLACSETPDIQLFEYELSLVLKPINIVNTEANVREGDIVAQKSTENSRWSGEKPVKQVVWEAVEELTQGKTDFEFAPKDVFALILDKYPNFNRNTVVGQITADCVNRKSRRYHSSRDDKYWWIEKGKYRLYDPEKDKVLEEV